jgi:hypothetical protein
MARDTLFLLKEDFVDGAGAPYYVDIRYVDFARPRHEIVAILSEQHQGCPVLILDQTPPMDALAYISGQANGKSFIAGAKAIGNYWSYKYGVSRPH